MSWNDDIRCLYCDGRLPLYRKLTQGQFCSSAHRKAYWQEQERLAVERLHQTHDTLRAYRPPAPLPVPLGPPHEEDRHPVVLCGFRSEILVPYVPALAHVRAEATEILEVEPRVVRARLVYRAPAVQRTLPAAAYVDAITCLLKDAPGTLNYGEPVALEPRMEISCPASPTAFDCVPGKAPSVLLFNPWIPSASVSAIRTIVSEPVLGLSPVPAVRAGLPAAGLALGAAPPVPVFLTAFGLRPASAPGAGLAPLPESLREPLTAGESAIREALVRRADTAGIPKPVGRDIPVGLRIGRLDPLEPAVTAPVLIGYPWPAVEAPVIAQPTEPTDTEALQEPPQPWLIPLGVFAPLAVHNLMPPVNPLGAALAANLPEPLAPTLAAREPHLASLRSLETPEAAHPDPTPVQDLSPVAASAPGIAFAQREVPARRLELRFAEANGISHPSDAAKEEGCGSVALRSPEPADFSIVPADVVLPSRSAPPLQAEQTARLDSIVPGLCGLQALNFQLRRGAAEAEPRVFSLALLPQPLRAQMVHPQSRLEPVDQKPAADEIAAAARAREFSFAGMAVPAIRPAAPKASPWTHVTGFWKQAPRDLKVLAVAIPALLALAFHPALPKVRVSTPKTSISLKQNIEAVVNTKLATVRQAVHDRAAVALDEDFRSGLDEWVSRGNATTEWSFDATGFVRLGPLALYRPSMGLSDYQLQFMGLIDKKALDWVVRASDFDNFYVIKLVVIKPGPLTQLGITRYAVIHGRAQNRADTVVPIVAREDMLYRVEMDVHDSTFSLAVQGHMVDTWEEPRLRRGGIGFFSASGEASRVRWLQITHQYDMLGRLCAYLTPSSIPNSNGSW